jgi:hypothetical protein
MQIICKIFGCTPILKKEQYEDRTFDLLLCKRCGSRHVIGGIAELVEYSYYYGQEKIKKEMAKSFFCKEVK